VRRLRAVTAVEFVAVRVVAPHLYRAVDVIEQELGRYEEMPAVQRTFELPPGTGYIAFDVDETFRR
jgi:hypothetical protein